MVSKRKFGGHWFSYHKGTNSKREKEVIKKRLKKQGYKVRVTVSGDTRATPVYKIWKR